MYIYHFHTHTHGHTPMHAHLQGSDVFKKFEETALEAYMVIRRKANLFINLFSMVCGVLTLTNSLSQTNKQTNTHADEVHRDT